MIKTIKTMSKQEKERYTVPRKVQDVIPVRRIWPDGIFLVGNKFSKTYKFSDINYLVASREDKESMFLTYSELLNSLDSGAVTKITINNRRMNKANFETSILMPMQGDFRDEYRKEYNQMLMDKATGANGITQEKYITISVVKKDIEEARAYFARVGADLISHFAALGSKCVELGRHRAPAYPARLLPPGRGIRVCVQRPRDDEAGPQLQGLYLPGRDREKQRLSEAGRQILPGAVPQRLCLLY